MSFFQTRAAKSELKSIADAAIAAGFPIKRVKQGVRGVNYTEKDWELVVRGNAPVSAQVSAAAASDIVAAAKTADLAAAISL